VFECGFVFGLGAGFGALQGVFYPLHIPKRTIADA
jgi:hypothetical protein